MFMRFEEELDSGAIWQLNLRAFGQGDEGALVDALRAEGHVRLSLVAEEEGRIVGHILFSRLEIRTVDGVVEALALAPMAVEPDRQRQGIGSALVREGLRICREQGHRIVVVLGHEGYYPRFGFSAQAAEPLRCAWSGPHLMALELVPGVLQGVQGELVYAGPFLTL